MDAIRAELSTYLAAPTPDNRNRVLQATCRAITQAVGSTRASLWVFNDLGDEIRCLCLLDTRTDQFESGTVLSASDFGPYFEAIRSDLKIVADHAATHPATACFQSLYFAPLDICSLLDHVVLVRSELTGVLCCEHCGEPRRWTEADMEALHGIASVLGLAFRKLAA
jgi:GAF domain-containing protein